jgi:hypothetical protein
VHSVSEPQEARLPRAVPAVLNPVGKRLSERGGKAASAGRYPQKIELHRTGNTWAWGSTPYTGTEMPCYEAFDCRIWQRRTAKPVLIAAMAAGAETSAQTGAVLAVSALLNILEEDMTGYLLSGRLPALLRGAVGEVQLMLEQHAHQNKRPVCDYASALLAVILTGTGGVIGQIGGGGALVQEEGAWGPVRWPGQGGDANNARSLTDADAFAAFQIAALPSNPRRICLYSAGLERILDQIRV